MAAAARSNDILATAVPELLVAAIVVLLAGAVAAAALRRSAASARRLVAAITPIAALAACALVAATAARRVPPEPPQRPDLPLRVADAGDTGSDACRACHPRQHATWRASYHRTMTQTASPHAVLGDFDDASVAFGDTRYRLFERDGRFYGEVAPPPPSLQRGDGAASVTVELVQTTGSHHMQLYWHSVGDDRLLEAFPLVYLRGAQRWIPRLSAFVTPPSHGEGAPSVWNYTCIGCHTTHPRPRLSGEGQGGVDSHVTELGIACESCHGPGAEHVAANRSPLARYRRHLGDAPDPTIANPAHLPHDRASQVCGQCHAVKAFYSAEDAIAWGERGLRFRPGDALEETVGILSNASFDEPFARKIRRDFPDYVRGSFWEDGTVRVTGREYNALLEAPCFQRGELSCLSCHTLHQRRDDRREPSAWADDQLAPDMDGDRACTQCHADYAEPRVVAEHTHHEPGSSGSACQNCHMPHTSYGLLKAIRAHEIGNPVLIASGPGADRPNACNLCHLDRPLGWTAEHLERWYGQPAPELTRDDRRVAAGVRWALEGDAGVRALVAWSFGWAPAQEASGSDWVVPYLAQLMDDPYDAVRIIASRSLRRLPGVDADGYDPLDAPAGRARATAALRGRVEAPSDAVRARATLFGADGRLDAPELARLLERRDERPLNLAE